MNLTTSAQFAAVDATNTVFSVTLSSYDIAILKLSPVMASPKHIYLSAIFNWTHGIFNAAQYIESRSSMFSIIL